MRNPIQKRLANLESWQQLVFMACLCERMYPNFVMFCQIVEQPQHAKMYHNILNLVWEYLTVKDAKINFEHQLEKFEEIIPDINDYDFFGIVPAVDACEALSDLLHTIIAGEALEQAVKVSVLSLQTVVVSLEIEENRKLSEKELKEHELITAELDIQWAIYRTLNSLENRDISVINQLKNEIRATKMSNIGVEISN
ncbi:YjaG family protein [Gallibacterium trehalosifermentans]|uniref:YjaG family protein n=1 Tax=Gallibacterium trehalosifermentans TaxID=516935 RepID=A0ABV6H1E9_9PAST